MLLEIRRPRIVTVGRTQSYRVTLRVVAEGQEDPAVFLCSREGSIRHFERVIEPHELATVPTDASKPEYRTDSLDLYVAAQGLAENMIEAIKADLAAYKAYKNVRTGTIGLSGASV